MSFTSMILSSLLTLVALVDSNAPNGCINSTTVNSVILEGNARSLLKTNQEIKQRLLGGCGLIDSEQLRSLALLSEWFHARDLKTLPLTVYLSEDRADSNPNLFSIPVGLLENKIIFARLFVKSVLQQNLFSLSSGVSAELLVDLVLADALGRSFVDSDWKKDGLGVWEEFGTLMRDCEKEFVPLDRHKANCDSKIFKVFGDRISPWALRWVLVEAMSIQQNVQNIEERVGSSRTLPDRMKAISKKNTQLDLPIENLADLGTRTEALFNLLGLGQKEFKDWKQNKSRIEMIVTHDLNRISLSDPLPKNTLILDFNHGFRLVTGESINLEEPEVITQVNRVAFIGCGPPTVREILEYSGHDRRLLYIENCNAESPLRLGMFPDHGASGVGHQNPKIRFLRFHQPSVKLALDWGLSGESYFEFASETEFESTPERYRRLFGWSRKVDVMRVLRGPLPVVDMFNARKDETLVLRGWTQSNPSEDADKIPSELSAKGAMGHGRNTF